VWIHNSGTRRSRAHSDLRRSSLAPRRLPIPEGNQDIASLDDVLTGLLVGLRPRLARGKLHDPDRPREQGLELAFGVFGCEIRLIVVEGQRQGDFQEGLRISEDHACHQPIGPLGERRDHG